MNEVVDAGEMAGLPHLEIPAVSAEGRSRIETARLVGRAVIVAAQRLGIPQGHSLDELLERIIAGAQGGRLDSATYRFVWDARAALVPRL